MDHVLIVASSWLHHGLLPSRIWDCFLHEDGLVQVQVQLERVQHLPFEGESAFHLLGRFSPLGALFTSWGAHSLIRARVQLERVRDNTSGQQAIPR